MRTTELYPSHPERICWGCDRYCAAHDLACGNGTIRTPHPRELFGDDWNEWADRHHTLSAIDNSEQLPALHDEVHQPDRDLRQECRQAVKAVALAAAHAHE